MGGADSGVRRDVAFRAICAAITFPSVWTAKMKLVVVSLSHWWPSSIRFDRAFIDDLIDFVPWLDNSSAKSTPCPGFRCLNGQCIHSQRRCDSKFNCYDLSDELNCGKAINIIIIIIYEPLDKAIDRTFKSIPLFLAFYTDDHVCPENYWKCTTSGQCIPADWVCDYRPDCSDGSDESPAECPHLLLPPHARQCRLDEYKCDSGQCIPLAERCFKNPNHEASRMMLLDALMVHAPSQVPALPRQGCADGSHLKGCHSWTCDTTRSQFKCQRSYCVHDSLLCDNHIDCETTWTDEIGCRKSTIDRSIIASQMIIIEMMRELYWSICWHIFVVAFKCDRDQLCSCIDITINCTGLNLSSIPRDIEQEISKM